MEHDSHADDVPSEPPVSSGEGDALPAQAPEPPAPAGEPPPGEPPAADPPAAVASSGTAGPTPRYRMMVAALIVVASLAGAGVAWSASVSSTKASDLDQLAQQQFLEQQQILTSGGADVTEELRRVTTFQQEIVAQKYFTEQAQALAQKYPALAAQLASEAQGQAALARNTGALFFAAFPQVASDGTVTYDRQQALNNLLGRYVIYQQLHPDVIQAQAADEHTKSGQIVGVGIVLVAALFFLTLAQVARTRSRHAFLVAGTAVLGVGLVLWLVVAL